MSFWSVVLHPQTLNWLVVLIIGTAATAIDTLFTNGVTVDRAHNKARLLSEFLVNQQLTYPPFFFALLAAYDLEEWYKNASFAMVLVPLVFFALGLINIKDHEKLLAQGPHFCPGSTCGKQLTFLEMNGILGTNRNLAVVSLLLVLILVFALQKGKKPEPTQLEGSPGAAVSHIKSHR